MSPIPAAVEKPIDTSAVNTGFRATNPNHRVYVREFSPIELAEMIIDPAIQRNRVDTEIDAIYKEFNPSALGVLTVSLRSDGIRSVVDGQQRREVILRLHAEGLFDDKVQVIVHEGLTIAEEAQLFLQLNYRRTVHAIRRFKTRLVAEEEQALAIKAILDELGLNIGPNCIQSVETVDRIFEQPDGPARLEWVLHTIQTVYDTNRRGKCYDGRVMGAFAMIHAAFIEILDEVRFVDAISRTGDRITKLQGAGTTKKELRRKGTMAYHMAEVLREWYNDTRKRDPRKPARLPEFPQKTLEALLKQGEEDAAITAEEAHQQQEASH